MKLFAASILLLFAISVSVSAQNTMKLFDANVITPTSTASQFNPVSTNVFASREVYLSCPIGGQPYAYLSGPNDGNLIVDNFFKMDGNDICPDEWNCFASVFVSPMSATGLPVESAYFGVPPIDIGGRMSGSGTYIFTLEDYSYAYGNSEIYLHTSCAFGNEICHRDNGKKGWKTLSVSSAAVPAHMAHGDTAGPCEQ
jgi:hypothetical protein